MLVIPDWAIGVSFIVVVIAVANTIFFRRGRTARTGAGAGGHDLTAAVEDLQKRLDALEEGQRRVAELEERLDFAERLLARQRDERLAPPKG